MSHSRNPSGQARPMETRVLMADPKYFEVKYAINPFMAAYVGTVDVEKARKQWTQLSAVYERLGFDVLVVPAMKGQPDLVFMANQSFPVRKQDGALEVLLSHMHSPERRREVDWVKDWYGAQGVSTTPLGQDLIFEGMGDCMWVPGQNVVMGGYGFRTEKRAVDALSRRISATVIPLQLVHPSFYHLDTCFSPIDHERAFYVPEAFDAAGCEALRNQFSTLVAIPLDEALSHLACNGHCPDKKHFIVQRGAHKTVALAQSIGLTVIEVDTSEFLKSGGSVYCMKLMLP